MPANTGEKRKLRKSTCICGQPVLIQLHGNSLRLDGKRVFYPDELDTGKDAFRCKTCLRPVSESVPGAEYETPTEEKRQCHCGGCYWCLRHDLDKARKRVAFLQEANGAMERLLNQICLVNSHGAVSVILPNEQRLGVKPYEFEVIEWHSPRTISTP